MNTNSLDWSLMQSFLAVAETGSLSAAARQLGQSQPTLGRQIKALETQLGTSLFKRQTRGFALTEAGAALVDPAKEMRNAASDIALRVAGQSSAMKGTVRITASVITATNHLPPIIAQIRREEPDIAIELVPSDDTRNLLHREADIAVRMYRPTQLDLITRHVGDLAISAFASTDYLRTRPTPTAANVRDHAFIGYDTNPAIVDGFKEAGVDITNDFFKTRCDDHVAYWNLIRAGCGIGFTQTSIAQDDPNVVEIDLGFPIPPLPVWLTAHEAMRQTPRIRRVWTILDKGLTALVS